MSTTPAVRSSATWAAWAVMISMGGASVTYNIWHATHDGHMPLTLALVTGLAPVAAAVLLSHVVAEYEGGKFIQYATFGVMVAVMTVSAHATAAEVMPAEGHGFDWVFAGALDAATLLALRVILSARSRRGEVATMIKAAEEAVQEARTGTREATSRAAQAVSELAATRESLTAERDQIRAELGAQLDAMRAELANANGALEALRATAHPAPRKRSRSAPAKARGSDGTADLTTELRAVQMLDAHPELRAKGQGAELARRLGVSPAHGRRLHAQHRDNERPSEPGDERSPDIAHERIDERSQDQS